MNPNDRVQKFLDSLVEEGAERGVQVAVYREGELIIDAFAGVADTSTGRKVDADTLFPVFSVTKGITATLFHIIAERGLLSYDKPVADVWPEFSVNGKEKITLRQAISHNAALHLLPPDLSEEQVADWDAMADVVADLTPAWPVDTQHVYHPVTWGWLAGEPIVRVTGKSFSDVLREEIVRPLGLRNLFIGMPEPGDQSPGSDQFAQRVAVLEAPQAAGPESIPLDQPNILPRAMMPLHELMNSPKGRRAVSPGSSGVTNARDLARMYAALLPGGVEGGPGDKSPGPVELLPPHRIHLATRAQNPDRTFSRENKPRSMGYALGGYAELDGSLNVFGHSGYGGSIAYADPDHRFSVAILKNFFSPCNAVPHIQREIRLALGTDA